MYNILQIQGNEKINDNLLDIMKDYNSISFTSKAFKQNLAGLPAHIKYIDISNTSYNGNPENLPHSLIGLGLPAKFITEYKPMQNLYNLPHGIKILYFKDIDCTAIDFEMFWPYLPPTLEYIASENIIIINVNQRGVKKILKNFHSSDNYELIINDIPFSYKYNYPIGY